MIEGMGLRCDFFFLEIFRELVAMRTSFVEQQILTCDWSGGTESMALSLGNCGHPLSLGMFADQLA